MPELPNSSIPTARAHGAWTPVVTSESQPAPRNTRDTRLAFRYFSPVLKARVELRDARPSRLFADHLYGNIIASAGPWRTSGDWWTPDPWDRDDWDIGLNNGGLYRIFLIAPPPPGSSKAPMTEYIELHARSAFSFLEGASLPEEMATACAAMESPAMALLDVDNVSGAPRYYLAAKKLGITAHMGAEISAEDGCRYPLLVENAPVIKNLCRLITSMKLRAPKGEARASEAELRQFSSGLVCLTGGDDGPLASALQNKLGQPCIDQPHRHLRP